MGFIDKLKQLITGCIPFLAHYVYGGKQNVASIEIVGDVEFCHSVKEAILLVKERDPLTFQLVNQYVRFIVRSGKTFLKPLKTSSLLAIQESEVTNNSQAWLACLLGMGTVQSSILILMKKIESMARWIGNVMSGAHLGISCTTVSKRSVGVMKRCNT